MIKISRHARKRVVERVKIPKRAVRAYVTRAAMNGQLPEHTEPPLRHWLQERIDDEGEITIAFFYQGFAFLFHDMTLVTVYAVPDAIMEQVHGKKTHD